MKKQITITLLALCLVVGAQAQSAFQIGIKGALNYSTLKSDDNTWLSSSNKSGYQVGIWTRIGSLVHVQPELYLTGKSSEAEFEINNQQLSADVNFTTLDLPVLIGTRVGLGNMGIRFQAGPLVSFVVDKSVGDALEQVIDVDNYKDNAFSLVGGVGLDIGKWRADVRYEHGMNSIQSNSVPDQKLKIWSVGVGIRLF